MDDKAIGSGYSQSTHIIGVPPSKVVYALEQILSEWKRVEDDKSLWLYQRSELLNKMAQMQAQQNKYEKEKLDLMKKIKILEYGLKVERARACAYANNINNTKTFNQLQLQQESQLTNNNNNNNNNATDEKPKRKKRNPRHYFTLPLKFPNISKSIVKDLMIEYLQSGDGKSTNIPLALASKHLRKDGKIVSNLANQQQQLLNQSFNKSNQQPIESKHTEVTNNNNINNNNANENKTEEDDSEFKFEQRGDRSQTVISTSGRAVPQTNNFTSDGANTNTVNHQPGRAAVSNSTFDAPDEPDSESTAVADSTTARLYANMGKSKGKSDSSKDDDENESKPLPSITNSSIFTPPPDLPNYSKDSSTTSTSNNTTNSTAVSAYATKNWKPKLVLRNHMDSVRSVVFDITNQSSVGSHSTILGSTSEDGTAKLWNLTQPLHPTNEKKKVANIEPFHTFRAHRGMVTNMIVKSASDIVITTGVDGQCIVWDYPPLNVDTYAGYGECTTFKKNSLLHTAPVWGLAAANGDASSLIYTACADGSVYIWKNSTGTNKPTSMISANNFNNPNNTNRIPCTVVVSSMDNSKLFVGYTSGELGVIDVEAGRIINMVNDTAHGDSRITCISSHPYSASVLSAHVDKTIRQYDMQNGKCYNSIAAHQDCVTSVSYAHDGLIGASASHDQTIRVWDLNNKKIIQSLEAHQTHRSKFEEAIHSVTFHSSMPLLASGGADSIVRVYT